MLMVQIHRDDFQLRLVASRGRKKAFLVEVDVKFLVLNGHDDHSVSIGLRDDSERLGTVFFLVEEDRSTVTGCDCVECVVTWSSVRKL